MVPRILSPRLAFAGVHVHVNGHPFLLHCASTVHWGHCSLILAAIATGVGCPAGGSDRWREQTSQRPRSRAPCCFAGWTFSWGSFLEDVEIYDARRLQKNTDSDSWLRGNLALFNREEACLSPSWSHRWQGCRALKISLWASANWHQWEEFRTLRMEVWIKFTTNPAFL